MILGFFGLRWSNENAEPPVPLGLTNGKLAPAPETPNCVSTQTDSEQHRIEPIPLKGSASEAIKKLQAIVESMPRTVITASDGNYLRAEFRSLIMGYIDDVEFTVDEPGKLIHFRSASRVGHSDLGVNRKRMEEIRRRYEAE